MAVNKNMIAVIADDFTGAAEIGGIGLRRGLKVLVETSVRAVQQVDLLVIATDTRSMSATDAGIEIEKVTRQLIELQPRFIFKKIDSVLRGNVTVELLAQKKVLEKNRILCVPANPHFGRIIQNGIYLVDNVPLAETSFANDPQYPAKSSEVKEILQRDTINVHSVHVSETLPEEGLIIGNVENLEEMQKWAGMVDNKTMYAGGSGFFDAVLGNDYPEKQKLAGDVFTKAEYSMFVFGSTFSREINPEISGSEIHLEAELFQNSLKTQSMNESVIEILKKIRENHVVSLSAKNLKQGLFFPEIVRKRTAELVREVMKNIQVDKLYIEGGATTYSVLKELNLNQLIPVKEIDFGIIEMEVPQMPGMHLITKPGSYIWPEQLFQT